MSKNVKECPEDAGSLCSECRYLIPAKEEEITDSPALLGDCTA
jgi:hypothetical protein